MAPLTATSSALLLNWLQDQLPAAPRGYLRQLLKQGRILVNGVPATAAQALEPGDRITLPDSARLRELHSAAAARLPAPDILLERPTLLVVFKPAGLAVHRGVGHETDNLTDRLAALCKRRGDRYRVAPIHRLDVGTSGPVLFGKGRRACATLGQAFMAGQVAKSYLALVSGHLAGAGELTTPVDAKGKRKPAVTSYRALEHAPGWTLLELHLHTGRQHQIRRQLAAAGHPLCGDRRYRGPLLEGLSHPFLHCRRLEFVDPADGRRHCLELPLPAGLQQLLARLGLAPT